MSLKQKLKNNELTIGSWIMMGNSMSVEVMALAGFEWLVVDIEHTSITMETAQTLILAIQAHKMKALVRVSKSEEVVIKKEEVDLDKLPIFCNESLTSSRSSDISVLLSTAL